MWCLLTGMAAWRGGTSTGTASRIWRWLARIRLRSCWARVASCSSRSQLALLPEPDEVFSEAAQRTSIKMENWIWRWSTQDRNLIRASHRQIRLPVAVEVADRQAAIPVRRHHIAHRWLERTIAFAQQD